MRSKGISGHQPVIWWLRRDLRLADNPALRAALARTDRVIPLFILDPALLNSTYSGEKRKDFLIQGLHVVDAQLRQHGSYLLIRKGDPEEILEALIAETSASAIFAESDHSPYARRRDQRILKRLPLKLVGSHAILAPGEVMKADGTPYTVFTPFLKSWKVRLESAPRQPVPVLPGIVLGLNTPDGLSGVSLTSIVHTGVNIPFTAGEPEAIRRLNAFTEGESAPIYDYAQNRDRPDLNSTSMLSPYLRFGMLSARTALAAARSARARPDRDADTSGVDTWINELAWRDFYIHILHHFPHVRQGNFRPIDIRWHHNPDLFDAWCQGRTGYPIIDAAMRQLMSTGWMHNRARMLVASFLTKDLLIDWRWGERWFMKNLIDGDPAANNGGWQWAAGTGTDAAPYFRIFNPVLQGTRYDPQGEYIRQWLPELAKVPIKFIHAPWEMPSDVQERAACRIGKEFPAPLVDHAWARQRALAAYSPRPDR